MSEKEFINFYEDGKIVGVADDNDIWLCENGSIVDLLNEQQATIQQLEKENDELKDKLDNIRREVINIDMFSDEALKHDIIAYREMHEFDNKDCYDIAWAIEKIGKECFR